MVIEMVRIYHLGMLLCITRESFYQCMNEVTCHGYILTYALSFCVAKTVLVGPKWFWSDQIYLDLTIKIWSRPKWNGHDQNELVVIHFGIKSQFGPDQFILVVTISFWSRPNHYGQVQINLVRPKPFWTDQNSFGHIEGQGIRVQKPKKIVV